MLNVYQQSGDRLRVDATYHCSGVDCEDIPLSRSFDLDPLTGINPVLDREGGFAGSQDGDLTFQIGYAFAVDEAKLLGRAPFTLQATFSRPDEFTTWVDPPLLWWAGDVQSGYYPLGAVPLGS